MWPPARDLPLGISTLVGSGSPTWVGYGLGQSGLQYLPVVSHKAPLFLNWVLPRMIIRTCVAEVNLWITEILEQLDCVTGDQTKLDAVRLVLARAGRKSATGLRHSAVKPRAQPPQPCDGPGQRWRNQARKAAGGAVEVICGVTT